MPEKAPVAPILIIKKKKGHGGHHGGAWKVAYADFVTAMMALFIVLWIVGQNKQVKDVIAAYFKDPGAFSETTRSGGILPGGSTIQPALKEPGQTAPPKVPSNGPMDEVERLKNVKR